MRSAAPLLLAVLAAAQQPSTRAAPAIRLEVAGPALWRAQFIPTNVGSLFASESGAALMHGYFAPLERALQQMLSLDDESYAVARARLIKYRGTLMVDFVRITDDDSPTVTFRLSRDGRTDLAALARDLAAAAQHAAGAPWQPGDDGGPRLLPVGGGTFLCEPFDNLGMNAVLAPRNRIEAAVAAAQAVTITGGTGARPRPQPAIALHLDMVPIRALMDTLDADKKMRTIVGFDALDRIDVTLATAGPHVELEVSQTFGDGERGLFGVFFPAVQGLPAIGALLPKHGGGAKVGNFDLAALHEVLVAALEAFSGDGAQARENIEKVVGKRSDGLLAQFTGEYLLFGRAQTPVLGSSGNATDWGMALRIRDGAAFAPKWTKLRKELGVTALGSDDLGDAYRTERFGGWFQFTALIGPELFVVCHGSGAIEQLVAIVANARSGEWTKQKEAPPGFTPLRRHAPPGWNGYAEGDVGGMLAIVAAALAEASTVLGHLPALSDLGEVDEEERAQVEHLLEQHNLRAARSMTGYEGRTWRFRLLW